MSPSGKKKRVVRATKKRVPHPPGFPVRLVGVNEVLAAFLKRKPHTQRWLGQCSRKSGVLEPVRWVQGWDTTTVCIEIRGTPPFAKKTRRMGTRLGLFQEQWWGFPGFPVGRVGIKELHAAFLTESRTREHGWRRVQEIRVARLFRPTYAGANVGHPSTLPSTLPRPDLQTQRLRLRWRRRVGRRSLLRRKILLLLRS
jgi:hypothetical protein